MGSGSWEVRVKGNLARRSNGRVNSSPVTTSTPIVRLQSGCTHNIRIPVQDADQDVIRCRWASSSQGECAGVCNQVSGSTLNGVSYYKKTNSIVTNIILVYVLVSKNAYIIGKY